MKKFWWSGEVEADIGDAYREAMKAIDVVLNQLLERVSFGKAEQWAFIAIIRKEDNPAYDELIKKSSRGKVLEFRLKIPHAEFFASNSRQRISLILKALSRSVTLMDQLGVSYDTQRIVQAALSEAERSLLSWVV